MGRRLRLTYAGESHFDRTRLLETGEIQPDGIELTYLEVGVRDLFRRMAQFAEFEVSEMSVSTMLMLVSRGDDRFVGLPVFPSRHFRHRQIYVRADAGISAPQDLAGRRVGVPEYQMTAALWIRAVLEHDYGVSPRDVHWLEGGLNAPYDVERFKHDAPPGVTLERVQPGSTLSELLLAGEIDAITSSQPPLPFRQSSPAVRRLFPDFRTVEREWYQRTGFLPIMHMVVMRRDVYEANRWIAVSLLDAFVRARAAGYAQLHDPDVPPVTHPWWHDEIEQLDALFGGDPFRSGFGANRAILDAMAGYSFEQGLSTRRVDPAELFAPEVLGIACG